MRRVLEISSYPPPRAGWGIRVWYLKRHLERLGHECVVLNIGTSRRIPGPDYETVMGGWDLVRKTWHYSRLGFRAHVHANGSSMKGVWVAILAALLNRATGHSPVLTFHAGVHQIFFPREKSARQVPVFKVLFASVGHVICNSEPVKTCIVAYGVEPEKVSCIPAFCPEYLKEKASVLPAHIESFYRRFPHILFSYLKLRELFYPWTLLDAFKRLALERTDVGLILGGVEGHSDPGFKEEFERRIGAPTLADRILVVDDLPHEEFLLVLAKSSVVVRTPITDGVSASVLEALSLGVPVVAVDNGSRPAGVLTYSNLDVDELLRRLRFVLGNHAAVAGALSRPPLRDTLSEEGRLLVANPRND